MPQWDSTRCPFYISPEASAEEARNAAEGDPTVQSGPLRVTVHPWLVAMANVALP